MVIRAHRLEKRTNNKRRLIVQKCKQFEEIPDSSALALHKVENHACLPLIFDSCWIMLSLFNGAYFRFAKNIALDYHVRVKQILI